MKLKEVVERINAPERMVIMKEKKEIFRRYRADISYINVNRFAEYGLTGDEIVKRIGIDTEIRHKEWEERGLNPPHHPDEMMDWRFQDLQMNIWITIEI